MSILLGNQPIAGLSTKIKYNAHNLLDFKWSDHDINDISWLRADTFSWQSGNTYTEAYNHLSTDIQGKTLQVETISDVTIQYYLATDGHKICPASEENNVLSLYNATGVAWYYILDTTNSRFKLPRTTNYNVNRYLYFYVGQYSQTAIEQTAGITSEQLNQKADITTPAIQAPYLKTTYVNGTSGCNIWSNGYCEQWGHITPTSSSGYAITVTFLKTFKDTNYMLGGSVTGSASDAASIRAAGIGYDKTPTGFTSWMNILFPKDWIASGYLAEGQY